MLSEVVSRSLALLGETIVVVCNGTLLVITELSVVEVVLLSGMVEVRDRISAAVAALFVCVAASLVPGLVEISVVCVAA